MDDKKVGELGRWLVANQVNTPLESKAIMLIRKLVRERAQVYYNQGHGSWLQCEKKARRDFGIPEEGWK